MTPQTPTATAPFPVRWSASRFRRHLAAHLLTLGFAVLSVFIVWLQYRNDILQATEYAKDNARAIAAQFDASFAEIERLLNSVEQRYKYQKRQGPEALEIFKEQLIPEVTGQPLIQRLSITDPTGLTVINTGDIRNEKPPVSLAGRPYFERAKNGFQGIQIEGPLQAKLDGSWGLVISKRMDDASANFQGVINALVTVDLLRKAMAHVPLGANGTIGMRSESLAQIFRIPALEGSHAGIGSKDVSPIVLEALADKNSRTEFSYETISRADGTDRIYFYKKLEHYPLWITAGTAPGDFAGPWKTTAALMAVLTVLFGVVVHWGSLRLHRHVESLDQQVAQRTEQLTEKEHFFRSLADVIPGMLGYWDAQQRNRFANAAYRDWFGKNPEELQGLHIAEVLGPAVYEKNRAYIEGALRGERQSFPRTLTKADGSTHNSWAEYVPDIEDGKVKGFVVLVTDVTELQQAKEAALGAVRAKSAFLANMSHEIRTPLAAVTGLLQVLNQTPLTRNQKDYLGKIDGAAKSLLALLNDILDFSKIDAGKLVIEYGAVPLNQLFQEVGVVLAAYLGNKPVEVVYDLDPALPREVIGDMLRLKQIFVNLGGNAIKFTPSGQVVISAKLLRDAEADTDFHRVEFRVSDSGIGIAEEHIPKLFSAFEQAEQSTTRKFGGTGLGLAITKRLIEMMGGSIRVESALGTGTTFAFILPFSRAAKAPETLGRELMRPGAPEEVLLVDDNEVASELTARTLRSFGWHVIQAASGPMALDAMRDRHQSKAPPFSLVYLDSSLTGMDGWATLRELHQLAMSEGQPVPKFVMLSANGNDYLGLRTPEEQSLVTEYLVKPVIPSMLFNASLRKPEDGAATRQIYQPQKRELTGLRILVVEDNAINQQIAEELLSSQGAKVSIAANGLEGTKAIAAATTPYDVVLMDIQMPVMDGYTATEFIRKELKFSARQLPIIGLTANAMATDRDKCLQAGMNDHVGKPFDLEQLVATIVRLVGKPQPPTAPHPQAPTWSAEAIDSQYAQQLQQAPELELELALDRMGGLKSLYARSAKQWSDSIPDYVANFYHAATTSNHLAARTLAHTLKGTAGTLGLHRMSDRLSVLEKELISHGNCDFLADQLPELTGQLTAAAQLLASTAATLAEQAKLEQPPPTHRPVSSEQVGEHLATLAGYLEQNNLEVLNTFASVREELMSLPEDEFNALEEALQLLDLPRALEICRRQMVST